MVQAMLLIIASSCVSFVAAGVDPFKPSSGEDDWMKEAEKLADQVKDMDGKGDSFDPDKILGDLKKTDDDFQMPDLKGLEAGSIGSIADAINDGANGGGMNLPELTTVSYENDPMHKKDPLKDPNSYKVLHELGMSDEEIEKMKNEPREETTVDVAIRECYPETHAVGCNTGGEQESPIRCLATAVKQKAADISEKCRRSTEKALPYACSVELFITHCDGVEQPLIACLDEHHPKLGPECLDFLVITKKVMRTLKKKPKVVREQESILPSVLMLLGAIVALGLSFYFFKGGSLQDLAYQLQMKKIKSMVLRSEPYNGKNRAGSSDWVSSLDEDKDDKTMQLNNFGGRGSSYGGLS